MPFGGPSGIYIIKKVYSSPGAFVVIIDTDNIYAWGKLGSQPAMYNGKFWTGNNGASNSDETNYHQEHSQSLNNISPALNMQQNVMYYSKSRQSLTLRDPVYGKYIQPGWSHVGDNSNLGDFVGEGCGTDTIQRKACTKTETLSSLNNIILYDDGGYKPGNPPVNQASVSGKRILEYTPSFSAESVFIYNVKVLNNVIQLYVKGLFDGGTLGFALCANKFKTGTGTDCNGPDLTFTDLSTDTLSLDSALTTWDPDNTDYFENRHVIVMKHVDSSTNYYYFIVEMISKTWLKSAPGINTLP